jgi:hypothetical protein
MSQGDTKSTLDVANILKQRPHIAPEWDLFFAKLLDFNYWLRGEDVVVSTATATSVIANQNGQTLNGLAPPVGEEWELIGLWLQDSAAIDTADSARFIVDFKDEITAAFPSGAAAVGLNIQGGGGGQYKYSTQTINEWRWQSMQNTGQVGGLIRPIRLRVGAGSAKKQARSVTAIVDTTATVGTRLFWLIAYVRRRQI